MTSNLGELLEITVKNLYHALIDKPRAYHDIDSDNPIFQDELTVVFTDGSEVVLKCSGRSEYDYVVMERPKYTEDSTRKQIMSITAHKGMQPVAVRYRRDNQRVLSEGISRNTLRIEVPYDFIRALYEQGNSQHTVSIPYKIIGGVMTLDTKVMVGNAAAGGT